MYYNGQSVQRDYAEAANWVRKAAEQGYAPAQAYLGVMYWNGPRGAAGRHSSLRVAEPSRRT
jgi:TPR repeat protein